MKTKARKLTAQCKCVDEINKQLANTNGELPVEMLMNFKTGDARFVLTIPIRKLDSSVRKPLRPNKMLCAYCPFCGKRTRESKD